MSRYKNINTNLQNKKKKKIWADEYMLSLLLEFICIFISHNSVETGLFETALNMLQKKYGKRSRTNSS